MFTSWLKSIFKPSAVSSAGLQAGTTFQNTQYSVPTQSIGTPQSGTVPAPYQIKTGDTFESIAAANGTTVPNLQKANSGMHIAPPKGSIINIPGQATVYQQGGQPIAPVPIGTGSFSTGGQYAPNLTETSANINQQLQNGQLPATIPNAATKNVINPATGRPFTDADYRASGYTYNNQTQQWELGGASQVSNQPADQTANQPAYLQTVNYNGRSMPAWEAELRMRRAARKARERAAAVVPTAEATNAGSLPATTLDVAIGGG